MNLKNKQVQEISDKLILANLDRKQLDLLTDKEIDLLSKLFEFLVFRKKFNIAYVELYDSLTEE
jgi:hypothetical protein